MIEKWSQSDTESFAKCEQAWYFRQVEGLVIPPGWAAHRGGTVHAIERLDMTEKISTGFERGLSNEAITDIAATEFDRRIRSEGVFVPDLTDSDQGKEKDLTIVAARGYGQLVSPEIPRPEAVERTLSIDLAFIPVPLQGTLDLIYRENQRPVISDLKTKAKRPSAGEAYQKLQPVFYKLLFEQTQQEPADFEYRYLVTTAKGSLAETVRRAVEETETVALLSRIQQQIRTVHRGDFRPAPPGAWWCSRNWCGYWDICPWVRKGTQT